MLEETIGRWEKGKHDLSAARAMFREEIYYPVAFLSHQAAEKALTALLIEKRRELPPKPHNLASRYLDAANGIPAENYDADKTERLLKEAERVHKWVTSAFEKRS